MSWRISRSSASSLSFVDASTAFVKFHLHMKKHYNIAIAIEFNDDDSVVPLEHMVKLCRGPVKAKR
jgi:hypothetical protein